MNKINFCYEISADAGVAIRGNGENGVAYTKVSLNVEEQITDEDYKSMHDVLIKQMISNQIGIEEVHLRPISYEEYIENADDDDE